LWHAHGLLRNFNHLSVHAHAQAFHFLAPTPLFQRRLRIIRMNDGYNGNTTSSRMPVGRTYLRYGAVVL